MREPKTIIAVLRERARDEGGFSLIELTGALTLLAIGFLALAGSASSAARLIVESRQRQVAAEPAGQHIEHVRNIPFDRVALPSGLTKSSDPENPDYYVSSDGLGYDHDGDGNHEPLVIDGSGDAVHYQTASVGPTDLEIYQYVTWVDDPAISGTQDYKRVTVVTAYDGNPGRPGTARASGYLTDGTVNVGGAESEATGGSGGAPTPTPTPSIPGGATCVGDVTPPSGTFTILSGTGADEGFTASTTVSIQLSPSDPCTPIKVQLSNDAVIYGSEITYDPANPAVSWSLAPGDGSKSVWARFKDDAGNSIVVGPKSITLDQTPPTAPTSLNASVSCSGSDRNVTLTWGAASDTNLLGYHVYRSVDNGAFALFGTTTVLTQADTHKKNLDSVRYHVKAYDRAGNEGASSNEISLSKNQCS